MSLEVFSKLNAVRFYFLLGYVVDTAVTLRFFFPKIFCSFVFRRGCSDRAQTA